MLYIDTIYFFAIENLQMGAKEALMTQVRLPHLDGPYLLTRIDAWKTEQHNARKAYLEAAAAQLN